MKDCALAFSDKICNYSSVAGDAPGDDARRCVSPAMMPGDVQLFVCPRRCAMPSPAMPGDVSPAMCRR